MTTEHATIQCRAISYEPRGDKGYMVLTAEREAVNDWESKHTSCLVFQMDVSPYTAKQIHHPPQSGEWLTVAYSIQGREWNGKQYTSLRVEKLERMATDAEQPPPPAGNPQEQMSAADALPVDEALPF